MGARQTEIKSSGGTTATITSPITTDPLTFSGVVTFNNAANTALTAADGVIDSTLTASRIVLSNLGKQLVSNGALTTNKLVKAASSGASLADSTITDDAATVTIAPSTNIVLSKPTTVPGGTGTGVLNIGGVIGKGVGIATTGTSEEVLATVAIPANTLNTDGAILRYTFFAHTAANANNKQLRVRVGGIGGVIVADSTAVAANNLNITAASSHVTRTSATAATALGVTWFFSNAASSSTISTTTYSSQRAAAITWTNANDLVITGTTPTAAGDLTLDSYSIEVVQ